MHLNFKSTKSKKCLHLSRQKLTNISKYFCMKIIQMWRIYFLKRRFGHILHFLLCSFGRWQFMCHSKQHIGKMPVKVAVFKINIILSIFMDFVYFHHIWIWNFPTVCGRLFMMMFWNYSSKPSTRRKLISILTCVTHTIYALEEIYNFEIQMHQKYSPFEDGFDLNKNSLNPIAI